MRSDKVVDEFLNRVLDAMNEEHHRAKIAVLKDVIVQYEKGDQKVSVSVNYRIDGIPTGSTK